MLKRLSWPATILCILVLAMAFRYNIEATKSTDRGVYKWERDRWTGRLWLKAYGGSSAETIVGEGNAPWRHLWPVFEGTYSNGVPYLRQSVGEMERQAYTYIWTALVAADGAWLYWTWRRTRVVVFNSEHPTP